MAALGTKDNPWVLKTPPGTSDYTMYRDEAHEPPILVCKVGSTVLHYDLRCIDDCVAMLKAHGDWMELGAADEQKPADGDEAARMARIQHRAASPEPEQVSDLPGGCEEQRQCRNERDEKPQPQCLLVAAESLHSGG